MLKVLKASAEYFFGWVLDFTIQAHSQKIAERNKDKIMYFYYSKKLISTSQKLRKQMKPEEKHLWYDFLKKLPITVNRKI